MALLVMPLIGGLTIGTALAQPRSSATALTAAQAEQMGTSVGIERRPDLAPGLAQVHVQAWSRDTSASGTGRLLALAPGGAMAAVAGRIGPEPTELVIARADGSQLHVQLPGLVSASFAPDRMWLAAIDGAGSLWRIDASSGKSTRVADGPFLGSPLIEDAGTILTLRVASVEAPFVSHLVRVAPDGSSIVELTEDQLVYGAHPLADGGLAVAVHQPLGTQVVREQAAGGRAPIADLGQDAVNVAVAPNGASIAWERAGEVYLLALPDGQPRRIASGSRPRFAPDALSLLVDQPGQSVLLDLAGRSIATFASQVAFDGCGEACVQ